MKKKSLNECFHLKSVKLSYRLPQVALQMDGEVYVTKCNCPAANGGQCSHIACMLYMVEEISHDLTPKIDEACTSKKQAWGVGSMRNIDPQPINKVITQLIITCSFFDKQICSYYSQIKRS